MERSSSVCSGSEVGSETQVPRADERRHSLFERYWPISFDVV